MFISDQENVNIDIDAALLIAKISDGGMRDALSLLDQCIAKSENNINSDIVAETAGLAGKDYIFKICQYILNNDSRNVLNIINDLYSSSKDMIRVCEEIIDYFRNLMLIKSNDNARELLIVSDSEYSIISNQTINISLNFILKVLDKLQTTLERMNRGSNKRIDLELAIIKICSPEFDCSLDSIIVRLEELEKNIKSKKMSTDKNSNINDNKLSNSISQDISSEEHLKNQPLDIVLLQKDAISFKDWHKVLNILKNYSKTIATAFSGSRAYISHNYVLIDSTNSMAFELLRKSSQRDKMRTAIQEITGKSYKLGPYKKEQSIPNENPLDELSKQAQEAGIELKLN